MALITGFWLYDVFLIIVAALSAAYVYFKYQYQHWKKRGVPVPEEPTFPFGNFQGVNYTRSFNLIPADIYKSGKGERIIGSYMFSKPILIVRDLDLVKNILVKDFSHFHDRGFEFNLEREPLAEHLFIIKGKEWRNLRIKLTPTFTSGKMKMMFPTMIDVGKELVQVLDATTEKDEVEVKDILSRFTTDVIASVAFGLEANSLKNPDNEFRTISRKILHPNLKTQIMNLILFASPWLAKNLPFNAIPKEITNFFLGTVGDTMDYRKKNGVRRNDFMQLLIQLHDQGYIPDADNPDKTQEEEKQKFTFNQATAQAFLFFFAGFETSASTIQFAMYELALNPDLQKRLQEEIDEEIEKNDGKLTYESVMTMGLLDRVVDETLRKYPVAGVLMRECNKEYPIPGTKILIKPKDSLFFPIHGYHHDPEYFPEPEKFDPDRFLPEAKASRPHYAYIPFGEGPRNCIGNRFALMQTKTGMALILSQFTISPSKSTPIPLVIDPTMQILAPKGKIHFKVTKRQK